VLRITIRAPINPTEEPARVRAAIEKLFPGATIRQENDEMIAQAPHLERLRELIRSTRIPDSARGAMLANLDDAGSRTTFLLGKQAATAGRAHFGPLRSPLGDLEVELAGAEGEAEREIYRIAPDTTVPEEWAEVPHRMRPDSHTQV